MICFFRDFYDQHTVSEYFVCVYYSYSCIIGVIKYFSRDQTENKIGKSFFYYKIISSRYINFILFWGK